jgi:acetyltransferase-like isoleucine patch superfamily enzyme
MAFFKFIKKIVKSIRHRPKIKKIGSNSFVLYPRAIFNGQRIYIGDNSIIGKFSVLHPVIKYNDTDYSPEIIIGNDVYIGGYNQIHCMDSISIGDGCVLSEHVYISDIAHGYDPEAGLIMKQDINCKGPVQIGEHTFIGYGVSVLPGVTLGKHCIVGTRSVVTHSFPDYSMIAGSPAKLVKKYNVDTKKWEKVK